MCDEEIIKAIKHFIKYRMYNYALMIDGDWGCGKTYFVKNNLMGELEKEEYKVTYISLYGIKNAETISEMVYSRILSDLAEKRLPEGSKKLIQGASVLIRAAARWGLQKLEFGKEEELEELVKLLPEIDNRVIVFDDLERCNCSITEVLGQINIFVEHAGAHVIILANENEIERADQGGNKELQMMIALNRDFQVEVPKNELEKMMEKSERYQNPEWSPDLIERRRQIIFQGNENYRKIKEKVVGQTIRYEPDLKKVFTQILLEKQNTEVGKRLLEVCGTYIDKLVEFAQKDKHHNLRTFQFFLEKSNTILETIENRYPSIHHILIMYCYRSCIRYMSGKQMPKWDSEYGMQSFHEWLPEADALMGFRFVDELITNNHFDVWSADEILKYYSTKEEMEGKLIGDPYQKMREWITSEDDQVLEWLNEINQNIKNKRYSVVIFPQIINYTAAFESKGMFTDICREIVTSMEEFIKNADRNSLILLEKEHVPGWRSNALYDQYVDEIIALIDERLEMAAQDDIDALITDKDQSQWGKRILDSLGDDLYIPGKSFICRVKPEVLAELIRGSNNQQLEYFRKALLRLYGGRIYYERIADDQENLTKLYELVGSMKTDSFGSIKKVIHGWLCENLNEYCKKVNAAAENAKETHH